jgi:hypothetical protein
MLLILWPVDRDDVSVGTVCDGRAALTFTELQINTYKAAT